jgi:hypothetical protein
MNYKIVPMAARKKIALVAHDNKKQDLFDWAKFNRDLLAEHVLYATGTTGSVLEEELDLRIHKLESGPWAATSRSAPGSRPTRSISLSSSGTRWSRCRTTPTSRR